MTNNAQSAATTRRAIVVGTIRFRDQVAWAEYRGRVGATIAAHQGEVMVRTQRPTPLTLAAPHDAVVVLSFPTREHALRWHASAEYQALVPLRDRGADVTLALYDAE
jgi:uncharacterized protein (DUF1330 family)